MRHSCVFEIVPTFLGFEEVADIADSPPEGVISSRLAFRKSVFSLAKAISIVLNSGEYFGRNRSQAPRSARAVPRAGFNGRSVCQHERSSSRNDHITPPDTWRELRADIAVESGIIRRSFDDPWSNKLMAAQARDEGARAWASCCFGGNLDAGDSHSSDLCSMGESAGPGPTPLRCKP